MTSLDGHIETVRGAIMGYCEDSIGSSPAEQQRVSRALNAVLRCCRGEKPSARLEEHIEMVRLALGEYCEDFVSDPLEKRQIQRAWQAITRCCRGKASSKTKRRSRR